MTTRGFFYAVLALSFFVVVTGASCRSSATAKENEQASVVPVGDERLYRMAVDQFGWRPEEDKIVVLANALVGFYSPDTYTPGAILAVVDEESGEAVYEGAPLRLYNGEVHAQSGNRIWHFDIGALDREGVYRIHDEANNISSPPFRISDDVYDEVMVQALRMFYLQRCGVAKDAGNWSDGVCHNQDRTARSISAKTDSSTEKDLHGGWHDAGDYNKYVSFTFSTLHHLLAAWEESPGAFGDANGIPESGNGIPDILDEILWEIEWLERMWQSDGSVLSKVSVDAHQGSSPASADTAPRYYGPASVASAITVASVFAHVSTVFAKVPSLAARAPGLLAKAEASWDWLETQGFPAYSDEYKASINQGFASAATEQSQVFNTFGLLTASVYLFEASGDASYNQYFVDNYTAWNSRFKWWWNQYDIIYEDAYLRYTGLSGANSAVASDIRSTFNSQLRNGAYKNWQDRKDGYLSYLSDNDYVWGSNRDKASLGILISNLIHYGLDGSDTRDIRAAAAGYLHWIHGRNPLAMVMITNMNDYGTTQSATEMYHNWFGAGTPYSSSVDSPIGPPPGYVTGGVNKNYAPAQGSNPLAGQPVQKWYKDWNTSWPENSWEITEPAIYYQAPYIRLLARMMVD